VGIRDAVQGKEMWEGKGGLRSTIQSFKFWEMIAVVTCLPVLEVHFAKKGKQRFYFILFECQSTK